MYLFLYLFLGFRGRLTEFSLYSRLQVPTVRPMLSLAVWCGPEVAKVSFSASKIPVVFSQNHFQ